MHLLVYTNDQNKCLISVSCDLNQQCGCNANIFCGFYFDSDNNRRKALCGDAAQAKLCTVKRVPVRQLVQIWRWNES